MKRAEDQRAKVLARQIDAWRHADEIRAFCSSLQDKADEAALEWIRWALAHSDEIDPVLKSLSMPVIPEPDPRALQPFLGAWSPYGP